MMTANTKKVITYLKGLSKDVNVTAADVAEELGMETKQVNGSFTAAIQRKGLGYRSEAEVELEDGTHKTVKFLKLTDEGYDFDPDAEEAAE